MTTHVRIHRWGNSLGLRIPRAFAIESGIQAGSTVDLSLDGSTLVARLVRAQVTLDELVGQVTPSNRHDPIDWGTATGREAW